ncbi:helix-turn-helix transcriptional regulator [Actinomycetaceae bacterium L2_0104]
MTFHSSYIFARRLRSERKRAGLNQTDLARRMAGILDQNVDPSAINRIELGTRAVRLEEAVAAAEALDVSLTALVYGASTEELDDRIAEAVDQLSGAHRDLVDSRARVTRLRSLIQHLEEERRDLIYGG